MFDSNPLRRTILESIKRGKDSDSRALGNLCSPRVGIDRPDDDENFLDHLLTMDHPSFGELILKEQVIFFQYYLTKGLIYSYLAHIKSETLFWLFQSTGLDEMNPGEYCIDADIPRGLFATWLFEIAPSFGNVTFADETVSLEDCEVLSKYDNVREGIINTIPDEILRSESYWNLVPLRVFL